MSTCTCSARLCIWPTLATLLLVVASVLGIQAPSAGAAATDCGAVLVSAADWLGGAGVDVRSNGAQQTSGIGCQAGDTELYDLTASPPRYGYGWQCVELANRLYATRGWYSRMTLGAETNYGAKWLYTYAESGKYPGLTAKANASGYKPVSGDMIIHSNGTYGHVSIVEKIDGSTLTAVEQNASITGRRTYTYDAQTGGVSAPGVTISGYIHADKNSGTTATTTSSLDDIVAINRRDVASNKTAVHAINGSNWGQYVLNSTTGLPMTDSNWDFELGDINGDGTPDIWAFNKNPGGSKTVLHVLDGKNPSNYVAGKVGNIGLPGTSSNWDFELGDYNADGTPDIWGINRNAGGSNTVVHVLDGKDWGKYLQAGNIALPGTNANWDFEIGELSGGGKPEIWGFNRNPGGAHTVVHVINGSNWGLYVQAGNIALPGVDSTWNFELGNFDTNGVPDIYGINRNPNGTNTVVHVINGSNWGLYHQAGRIVLHGTSADWTFAVGNLR